MSDEPAVNLWSSREHALRYLGYREAIPHRDEGFAVLGELLPESIERVLDLGTGDGVTLGWVRSRRPGAAGVGLDFSEAMLEQARTRFADDPDVEIRAHDLEAPLPGDLGRFDVVVSSFAIHHLADARKRALYGEVYGVLRPGGRFLHLEHVRSPTRALHDEFLEAMGTPRGDDDPSNKLAALDAQLGWLLSLGFEDVDVFWKWRELALFGGRRRT